MGWTLLRLASATMAGSGSMSGNSSAAMTKQQVSPRTSMMSSRRDMAASQVTHRGEGFSSGPPGVSRYHLPFISEYWPPLDLEAEPAAALGPDGKIQLGRPGVPLPFVDGEA